MESSDLRILKEELDSSLDAIKAFQATEYSHIKIQSLLNVLLYVKATRFLEASVKHILYSCYIFKGSTQNELDDLTLELKGFNNPEFTNIKEIVFNKIGFDILSGKNNGYSDRDISFLNEIVRNRHKNVHASESSINWFNSNQKGLIDFEKEYEGLVNIVNYLERIKWDPIQSRYITIACN